MKKTVKSVLCLVLVLSMFLCLCACSSDKGGKSSVAGRYNMVSMEMDGMVINLEDYAALLGDVEFYLDLKADGTGKLCSAGEIAEIEWNSTKMWPVEDPTDTIEYKVDGNVLTLEQDGMKMVFKK